MREQFPGYYFPKDEEFAQKFKECVFCFDTNVLLNLYRYTPESRDNLIKVLEAFKDRVWLPHQVGFEYQRRRTDVLLGQIGLSGKLEGILDASIEQLEQLRRSSLFMVNSMIDPIKGEINDIKKKLQEKKEEKPNLMTGDPVFDAVTELFDGKVGAPYKEEKYKEIYKSGKDRYDAKIPPGYMDRSNNPNDTDQYGDFVLWSQLLDYAKTEERPIILVTDDAKEDWWREVRGEKLGPRPELISEFIAATGGDKWFYMYSTEQFLKYSKEHLDADVQPEVIKEAEGIEKTDVEQEKFRMAVVDFQEAQDNLAAVEAIAHARALNIDSVRETLARINIPTETLRKALSQVVYPGEELRRALAQVTLPSEEIRRALSQVVNPGEEWRRALAHVTYPREEILRALSQATYPSEELRRALAQVGSISKTDNGEKKLEKSKEAEKTEQQEDAKENDEKE